MKIVVCIKQVPDTEAAIRVGPSGTEIESEGINYIVSPYDEYALEEALRIREKAGGEITAITMGQARAKDVLRHAQALGVNRAIHLLDPAFEGADASATAQALAKVIGSLEYDMVLCGRQAIDDDHAQVGIALAELLNVPHVNLIIKLEVSESGRSVVVHRQVEGATEVIECPLPAVFTAQKGLNEPRYPTLKGIMGAKKMTIEEMNLAAVGLPADRVGAAGSYLKIVGMAPPPPRQAGKPLEGEEPEGMARKLASALREARII